MQTEQAIYPIGRYEKAPQYSREMMDACIDQIGLLPYRLDTCIENLDTAQLETSYRLGGWSINQVIHHLADSHMNMFIRTKLALTENNPTIKPYNQDLWVMTADVQKVPVNYSITLIHALHYRWVRLLKDLDDEQFNRTFFHPERNDDFTIWQVTHMADWHGRHHSEQIKQLRSRKGW